MEIAVAGASHAGVVCAAGLAAVGHRVRVADPEPALVARLDAGSSPYDEPDLEALMRRGIDGGTLSFHTHAAETMPEAELVFLCEPATAGADEPHLSGIMAAAVDVSTYAATRAVVVNRIAAPIGTLRWIRALLDGRSDIQLACNPAFLMVGSATTDFLHPYRIVVGAWEVSAVDRIFEALHPISRRRLPDDIMPPRPDHSSDRPVPAFVTTPETAELSTYAAKALMSVRTSFVNEMAEVAERSGADIEEVVAILSLDPRLGSHLPRPGLGWTPSSLPRDVEILDESLETLSVPTRLLAGANAVNDEQAGWIRRKLVQHLRTLEGRTIAVLGLGAEPPGDVGHRSRALEVAIGLVRAGARVRAFDPAVRALPDDADISLVDDVVRSARDADAVVVASRWEGVHDLPLDRLRGVMRHPLLVDGCDAVDEGAARAAGIVYVGIGHRQPNVLPLLPSPDEPGPMADIPTMRRKDEHPHPLSPPDRPQGGARLPATLVASAGTSSAAALDEHWVPLEPPDLPPVLLPEARGATWPWMQLAVKRAIDIVASLVLMIVLFPLLVIVALVVRLDSRGPALFMQERVGRGGRPFRLVKFRTMSSETTLDGCLDADPHLLREWEETRKIRRDPRVTSVGHWLRRSSLDELPQLWNVLIGHMSLVGPRPVQVDELLLLGHEASTILVVRPGLTGLWAVSGRSDVTYRERALLEFRYVVEWNLRLDLRIMLLTIPAVVRGHGAY
jgi:UDPglucose 6-dehydrogenase